MPKVKYLRPEDEPLEVKPLNYIEWCKHYSRTDRNEKDDCMNLVVADYVSYLSNFNTNSKGVEFTHYLDSNKRGVNWVDNIHETYSVGEITYLGKDHIDGDMFSAVTKDYVRIFKGNLNNGTY